MTNQWRHILVELSAGATVFVKRTINLSDILIAPDDHVCLEKHWLNRAYRSKKILKQIPCIQVQLSGGAGKEVTVVTGKKGEYYIEKIESGTYTISVQAEGIEFKVPLCVDSMYLW